MWCCVLGVFLERDCGDEVALDWSKALTFVGVESMRCE